MLESDSFFYWATDENNRVVRIEQVDGDDLSLLGDIQAHQVHVAFVHPSGYLVPAEMHDDELLASMVKTSGNNHDWEAFSIDQPQAMLYLPGSGTFRGEDHPNVDPDSVAPFARYFLYPDFVEKVKYNEAFFHLHFMESLVYIALYRGGKLLLWQTVPLSSAYELQYFILMVYHQFNMDRSTVPLLLSGRISAGSQMYHLIYPYFARIQWVSFPEASGGPILPGTIPAHYLADLWLIHQCAS